MWASARVEHGWDTDARGADVWIPPHICNSLSAESYRANSAAFISKGLEHRLDLGLARHVCSERYCLAPVSADLVNDRFGLFRVSTVVHADSRFSGGKGLNDASADAGLPLVTRAFYR
jgi:hypothetical protein